jgi:hypothetical protein
MRSLRFVVLAGIVAGAAVFGWPWVALAVHASSYPVTASGETANVVIADRVAYATRADRGFEVIDVATQKRFAFVPPPSGSESVDDLSVADHFLFALDARPPGHLSVFSLDDPSKPRLVSPPVSVAVGPFSGVSAGSGNVLVSGGTSHMSLRSYDARGTLSGELASADFGRGQPDVLLAPDGARAFVSTHRFGPYFGLTTAQVGKTSIRRAGSLDLATYGFTPGGAKPASFPLKTALDGDVLLVADVDGLSVVSIANLAQPKVLAHLDAGVKAVNVDARDHLAAVVGSSPEPRLVLIDVSAPASPRIVRAVPLAAGSYPTGVAIGATHIAVASHHSIQFIPR